LGTERTMRKLMNGVLIGFGSALSIVLPTSWHLLMLVLDSEYLIVAEAKVIEAAQIATSVGTILGIILVVAGSSLELLRRKIIG